MEPTDDAERERRVLSSPDGRQEFVLPWTARGVLLTALPDTGIPARKLIPDLRFANGEYVERSQDVVWEVELRCDQTPEWPYLHGSVLVDEEPRIPADLRIMLLQGVDSRAATLEELALSGNRRAIIQNSECQYWVWPVAEGAQGLWVTSAETLPLWIPVQPRDVGRGTRIDVRCSTGRTLVLDVVETSTRRPVPFLPLSVDIQVPVDDESSTVTMRTWTSLRATDATGRCTIPGIPMETGHLRVRARAGTPSGGTLFESHVRTLRGDPIRATAEISLRPESTARVWGFLPAAGSFSPPTCFPSAASPGDPEAQEILVQSTTPGTSARRRKADLDRVAGTWFLSLRPGDYDLWIRSGRVTVSETRSLHLEGGAVVGPVSFEPLAVPLATVSWSGGPRGARLRIEYLESDGKRLKRESVMPLPERGSCSVPLRDAGVAQLQLSVERDGAYEICYVADVGGNDVESRFDLHGSDSCSLSFTVNGERPSGSSLLSLYHLPSDGAPLETAARCTLTDGVSAGTVPLPPGRYFYSVRSTRYPGPLSGLVELGRDAETVIAWHGQWTRVEQLPPAFGGEAVELTSIGGTRLEGLVPLALRRHSIRSLFSENPSRIYVDLEESTWRER